MATIRLMVLERAVKWLVSGQLFGFIQDAVKAVNSEDMTGEEKRENVKKHALALFSGWSTMFINLAIEVAVILMRAEMEKK